MFERESACVPVRVAGKERGTAWRSGCTVRGSEYLDGAPCRPPSARLCVVYSCVCPCLCSPALLCLCAGQGDFAPVGSGALRVFVGVRWTGVSPLMVVVPYKPEHVGRGARVPVSACLSGHSPKFPNVGGVSACRPLT